MKRMKLLTRTSCMKFLAVTVNLVKRALMKMRMIQMKIKIVMVNETKHCNSFSVSSKLSNCFQCICILNYVLFSR